jgi:hypothetical protein
MAKLYLLVSFFLVTPLVLVLTLIISLYLAYQENSAQGVLGTSDKSPVAYAALPTSENVFEATIISGDARVEAVRQFLEKYDSPLEPHAQFIVDKADEYELDYRLVPAIAMQESNVCKKMPKNKVDPLIPSNNCWGYGVYGGKVRVFKTFEEGIETVTKSLATKYKDKHGLETPDEIMKMYTPGSNGSWAFGVNHFMNELDY